MSNRTTEPDTGEGTGRRGRLRQLHDRLHANPALALTTKIVVTAVGVLVILAGFLMMVAPGPGIVAVILGLAILSTEWDWADRWLRKAKAQAKRAKERAEQMDPRVRRRRLLVAGAVMIVLAAASSWYVVSQGWPGFAVDGWDWVQSLAGWLPELPGPTAESLRQGAS